MVAAPAEPMADLAPRPAHPPGRRLIKTAEFERWQLGLDPERRARVQAAIEHVTEAGPTLGRPRVDTIQASRVGKLKEARVDRSTTRSSKDVQADGWVNESASRTPNGARISTSQLRSCSTRGVAPATPLVSGQESSATGLRSRILPACDHACHPYARRYTSARCRLRAISTHFASRVPSPPRT
jgi:hypothetical protein